MGKFRRTGFEKYCWNTTWALRFEGVELEKGLAHFSCGEINGRHSEFFEGEVMWLEPFLVQVGIGGND